MAYFSRRWIHTVLLPCFAVATMPSCFVTRFTQAWRHEFSDGGSDLASSISCSIPTCVRVHIPQSIRQSLMEIDVRSLGASTLRRGLTQHQDGERFGLSRVDARTTSAVAVLDGSLIFLGTWRVNVSELRPPRICAPRESLSREKARVVRIPGNERGSATYVPEPAWIRRTVRSHDAIPGDPHPTDPSSGRSLPSSARPLGTRSPLPPPTRLLAFVSCPMFGRLSDVIGRRKCLFVTVLGTGSPLLALFLTSNLWAFAAAAAFSGERVAGAGGMRG